MRLSVALVVAAAALLTADAAKINTKRRLGNNHHNKNNAGEERKLSSGKGSTIDMAEGTALSRAEADGLNRAQICAAGQARSSMMELIYPTNFADSTGTGKAGKGGKVSDLSSNQSLLVGKFGAEGASFGIVAHTKQNERRTKSKSKRRPHQLISFSVLGSTLCLRWHGITTHPSLIVLCMSSLTNFSGWRSSWPKEGRVPGQC
jgi:hypothetical protein